MPLYEYVCRNCGRVFEARRGFDEDDSGIECPTCGARDARRVFSTFSSSSSDAGCGPGGFS